MTVIERAAVAVCVGVPASVASRVNAATPAEVGVPETTPVGERLNPLGRAPEATDQR
jgi:hypothetical protein